MHLAAAVGTPVLAIFRTVAADTIPPLSPRSRIVRIDIHCSPCNLLRQPPTPASTACRLPGRHRDGRCASRGERNAGRVMTSRPARGLAVCAAFVSILSAFPPIVERLLPPTGLTRSVFTQVGFRGVPVDASTFDINLGFLDQDPTLPRQNFSARWRGFFYVSDPQTIEFFAGGNDEVELRVDGEVLLTRNLREGMRTLGRRVSLDAGAPMPSTISSSAAGWR